MSCPPLKLALEDLERRDACAPSLLSAQYGVVLHTAAQSLRQLWRTASRHHAPRRYRSYFKLMSSMMDIECLAVFSGCFPGGWQQEALQSQDACGRFRADLEVVTRLDAETEAHSAYLQLGIPELRLSRHACFGGRSADLKEHLTLRSMAVALGSKLLDVEANWIPSFTMDGCEPWWQPEMPPMDSLRQKGWVINLGAGDGSCAYDLFREDALDNDIFKADDPANCLLHEGFAGIIFEGDAGKLPQLREALGRRADVFVVLGVVNPTQVVEQVRAFRARLAMEPELLKVDLDNGDCEFVEVLLKDGHRPREIHVEVSSFISPPLVYRTNFDPSIGADSLLELGPEHELRGHMVHCSLSAYVELLEPYGYTLVRLFMHDALFVQDVEGWRDLGGLEQVWFRQLWCHPLRSTLALQIEHSRTFLFDYSVWNSLEVPAAERRRRPRVSAAS